MTVRASRRAFLAGATIFALVTGLPVRAIEAVDLPSPELAHLLNTISQLVIPRSDTPGAGEVGVGAFLSLALAHGLEGTRDRVRNPAPDWPLRADGSLRHDLWLAQDLQRRGGQDFLVLSPTAQAETLAALDREAFRAGSSPWLPIKALILTGYYTSEAGGSQELQYSAVPGRWDADIPLKPGDRAWSSDWTAVEFG